MGFGYFGAEDPDIIEGQKYLRYFYDVARTYPDFGYKTFEEFLNAYGDVKSKIWHKNVGQQIRVSEMPSDEAIEVLEKFARAGEGKLPRLPTDFGQAITDQATSAWSTFQWITKETAKDVASEVVSASQDIAATVKSTLSVAKYAVPAILVAGLAYWVFTNAKRFSLK